MKVFKSLFLAFVFIFSLSLHANTGGGASVDMNSSSSGTGMKSGAEDSSKQESLGQALNMAMGGGLIAYGIALNNSTPGSGTPYIIMGLGNLAQAAMMGGASKHADEVGGFSTDPCAYGACSDFDPGTGGGSGGGAGGGGSGDNPGGGDTNPFAKKGSGSDPATLARNLDNLKSQGYKLNEDGSVTDPKGKTYPAGFGSVADLKSSGADGKGLAFVKNLQDEYNKKFKDAMANVSSMGFNNAGGGAGGGGSSYQADNSDPFADFLKKMKNKNRAPTSVAGMKKVINGDAIGVAQDNIFDMIHRRYKKKKESGFFLGR